MKVPASAQASPRDAPPPVPLSVSVKSALAATCTVCATPRGRARALATRELGDGWDELSDPEVAGFFTRALFRPLIVLRFGGAAERDETIKRRLYERFGVAEYWIVDLDIDVVSVYCRDGDRFGRPSELFRDAGDVLTTSLLPGLELPLDRVFRA